MMELCKVQRGQARKGALPLLLGFGTPGIRREEAPPSLPVQPPALRLAPPLPLLLPPLRLLPPPPQLLPPPC